MKYGIISDIHGNIYALEAALKYLDEVGFDKMINLGDMIGYGANPTEVIGRVRDKDDYITIAGNHDRQVSGEKDPRMRKTAARALEWTQDNVSPNNARWLQSLPQGKMLDEHPIVLVHGSLCERDTYILTGAEIKRNLEVMINEFKDFKICLFGHTHVPLLVSRKTLVTDLKETKTFQLDPNDQYLINPGSVGQPRDRCPLAAFGIIDTDKWTMTFVRKEYDIPAAQKAIIDAGLPDKFSSRLAEGT